MNKFELADNWLEYFNSLTPEQQIEELYELISEIEFLIATNEANNQNNDDDLFNDDDLLVYDDVFYEDKTKTISDEDYIAEQYKKLKEMYEEFGFLPPFEKPPRKKLVLENYNEKLIIMLPIGVFETLTELSSLYDTEIYVELPIDKEFNGYIIPKPEIYIPDQKITEASVHIDSGLNTDVIGIHTHPSDMTKFSLTDEESINSMVKISGVVPIEFLQNKWYTLTDLRYERKIATNYIVIPTMISTTIKDIGVVKYRNEIITKDIYKLFNQLNMEVV